ncbi:hypothetical protein M440DRAFT_1266767 [Trichoderma longibrachiatum ATCC 18648]|uniref:Uncharacterized protein n=1 Tax=Trichoderma longibrachiatum ATCC 18648 TaxID=983965 RepID=A0A2T4C0B2_TRILO|nr:hypothetical protein M440DRAFT_1266767 [Trichoderma longibrachiatum ATCC 18648]
MRPSSADAPWLTRPFPPALHRVFALHDDDLAVCLIMLSISRCCCRQPIASDLCLLLLLLLPIQLDGCSVGEFGEKSEEAPSPHNGSSHDR